VSHADAEVMVLVVVVVSYSFCNFCQFHLVVLLTAVVAPVSGECRSGSFSRWSDISNQRC
jgi:hypothetical protein